MILFVSLIKKKTNVVKTDDDYLRQGDRFRRHHRGLPGIPLDSADAADQQHFRRHPDGNRRIRGDQRPLRQIQKNQRCDVGARSADNSQVYLPVIRTIRAGICPPE